ncbi:MAG: non-canonical purine NTP pyrophosphatase [Candidatus Velthaea sp.]
MRVYVATANAGKLRELQALFAPDEFELVTADRYESPAEGDTSYGDNAALKALALHARLVREGIAANVLADDSGIEVAALARRPGVLTAYYGGAAATWPERRRRLIDELAATGSPDRAARFVCAMHFVGGDGREFASMATVTGEIAYEDRGAAGFSFDPIFVYPPLARTFAELIDDEKNRVSHRAVAAAGLIAEVRASYRVRNHRTRGKN